MTKAHRFLFERDFRDPHASGDAKHGAELRAAEERGFARGTLDGRRSAEAGIEARVAAALETIAAASNALLSRADAHGAEVESDGIAFALALGRKLAGEALEAQPLAAIAQAASGAFQHLRGVPHLVVRVHDSVVEPVEKLIRRLAAERGFDGRIVVLGEPEIRPHDVRLEWADGGIVRDQARVEAAAAEALSRARRRQDASRSDKTNVE
jgi:flagellar assembly protein FliH